MQPQAGIVSVNDNHVGEVRLGVATDTIEFSCSGCGQVVRARVDDGGRAYRCNACGATGKVPKVELAPRPAAKKTEAAASTPSAKPGTDVIDHGHTIHTTNHKRVWLKIPATFGELLGYIVGSWAAFAVVLFFLSLFSTLLSYLSLGLFLISTFATIQQIYLLMRARQRVLVEKDTPLLWGFVRLIAWDPIEGVLFLQNKSLGFADDNLHDGQGGVRFIYPIFGDELALRVPLEVQTLQFADEKVLTREYLSVTVMGTLKWRITDIRKFYLLVSRELRTTADHANPEAAGYTSEGKRPPAIANERVAASSIRERINLAIMWLRVLTEEQTRMVISRVSSGLLIADRLATEVPEIKAAAAQDRSLLTALAASTPRAGDPEWTGAADGLARTIYDALTARVAPYGIHIEEVSLREIRLPEEIVQECVAAAKTAYLPLVSQRNAAARIAVKRAELATEVELLGREAVAAREIVSNAPAYGLADFLSQFLKSGLATPGVLGLASAATAASAALPANSTSLPDSPAKALPAESKGA